jgi:hypothetical protein
MADEVIDLWGRSGAWLHQCNDRFAKTFVGNSNNSYILNIGVAL